jgi:ribosomal protein S18 acetylase RimI-like enzyme
MSNLLSGPRDAVAADLPGLLMLEAGFPGDRLSARQYRHHIGNPAARLRVMIDEARVVASSLCLFRRGSRRARLYSIVVDPALRGQGLGAALLADAEAGARARGCDRLRLEVRADNRAAIALYGKAGFEPFDRVPGYYQDGAEALRMEKRLAP